VTGFGIFQHGGFGKPHALGIITLVTLVVAGLAGHAGCSGRFSRQVEIVSYSATFLFHWIPAVTETTTRLPVGAPLFPDAEAPGLQLVSAVLFVLFLVVSLSSSGVCAPGSRPCWRLESSVSVQARAGASRQRR